jgi:L-threonine kinase
MNEARVLMPGGCGELVQGTLDGVPFLVTCPIDRWSQVAVRLSEDGVWRVPADSPKAAAAIQAALDYFGCPEQGGSVKISSTLPRGKGYASSTADTAGTIYALAHALGRSVTPWIVARLALAVEPSDSVMFPGLALMDHRTGRRSELLGDAPDLALVVADEGGTVDTLAFNRPDRRRVLRALAPQHREALDVLRRALRDGDLEAVGEAATLSAMAHQRILPKVLLPEMLALCREVGALGVCVAHSGTLLGLMLDPAVHDVDGIAGYVRRHLPSTIWASVQRVVGGGPRPVEQAIPC